MKFAFEKARKKPIYKFSKPLLNGQTKKLSEDYPMIAIIYISRNFFDQSVRGSS